MLEKNDVGGDGRLQSELPSLLRGRIKLAYYVVASARIAQEYQRWRARNRHSLGRDIVP